MTNCSTPIHLRNFLLRFQARQEYALPVLLKEPAHTVPSPTQIQELHNEYGVNNQLSDKLGMRAWLRQKRGGNLAVDDYLDCVECCGILTLLHIMKT